MEAKRNTLLEKWHSSVERSVDGSLNNDVPGEIIFVNSWNTHFPQGVSRWGLFMAPVARHLTSPPTSLSSLFRTIYTEHRFKWKCRELGVPETKWQNLDRSSCRWGDRFNCVSVRNILYQLCKSICCGPLGPTGAISFTLMHVSGTLS